MRAALYDHTGPAREVLRVTEIGRPEPGPGDVRVRVSLSGINPTDWKARSGAVPRPINDFQIPHQDGAGVIDAVGAGVSPDRVGEQVWLYMAAAGRKWGTAAEWTVVPEKHAVALPDGVAPEVAVALGVPALTAHRCLFSDGPIAGQTVLVAGGAGAVGHFAIELAKHAGAKVVSTVSGPEKAALATAAGADHVVNYRDADAADQIRSFAPAVDRVIELALGTNLQLDLAVLRPHGRIVNYAADGDDPVLPVRACMTANVTLEFMLLYGVPEAAIEQAKLDITMALADGALTALPVTRFGLDDVAAAHEAAEAGATGKVVLDLA
jgi:NADPH2:quinone reductase